jgi:hypothetical protein
MERRIFSARGGVERGRRTRARFDRDTCRTLSRYLPTRTPYVLPPTRSPPRCGCFKLPTEIVPLLGTIPYWDDGMTQYSSTNVPLEPFQRSATREQVLHDGCRPAWVHGSWLMVELGDGQVAGLPETAGMPAFNTRLLLLISYKPHHAPRRYFLFSAVCRHNRLLRGRQRCLEDPGVTRRFDWAS